MAAFSPYALLACQFVVGGLFLLSSTEKLRSLSAFGESLGPFGIPAAYRHATAIAVTGGEFLIAALIGWSVSRAIAFAFAAVALTIAAVVVARVVRTGTSVHCRCFGTKSAVLRGAHVARNVGLAIVATLGLVLSVEANEHGAMQIGPSLVTAVLAFAVVLAVSMFDDLVALTRR